MLKPSLSVVILLTSFFLGSCRSSHPADEKEVVVSIGENKLTKSDLYEALGTADSSAQVEIYIQEWIRATLLYDKAKRNVSDLSAIDKLTEEYRRNLIVFEYEKELVNEKIAGELSEEELRDFYDTHRKRFLLKEPLIKGIFLKIPANAPQLEDVKKWMKKITPESLEKLEKYSLQNALVYEYFFDRWVPLEEVMQNIPYQMANADRFLREQKALEVTQGDYWYYLNINESVSAGNEQPFEYALPQVKEVVLNQKRKTFIREMSRELYDEAIRHDKVKFYRTEPSALN
ncbi:MAG: peptidylprolyl isomerase [Bacteroidales bacterium]